MLVEQHGTLDYAVARDIITFLSPDRTPGFWTDTLHAGDAMSAVVEGSITVADLTTLQFQVKGGYWADDFLQFHFANYF